MNPYEAAVWAALLLGLVLGYGLGWHARDQQL